MWLRTYKSARCVRSGTMLRLCLVLQLCAVVVSQRTILDSTDNLHLYRGLRKWIFRNFGIEEHARKLSAVSRRQLQEELPPDVPFPCNVTDGRSTKVPDSVHRLRPGDIDVIAAIGDSLTAGAGILATNLLQVAIENRGVAAAIGGQGNWRTYLTLPNILKEYNPNLIGYALGDSLTSHSASQLNVAESGAMSRDMPFMAKYLVNRMKKDTRINMKKHWKLISILIGHNDFCNDMCFLPSASSTLEAHRTDLIETLRIFRDNLPRTLVALTLPPNLKSLVDAVKGQPEFQCYFMTQIECPCLMGLQFRDRVLEYYDIMTRWQKLEEEVANYPEFNKKDFTVTVVSTLRKATMPKNERGIGDMTYFSADCFHVSQKVNARWGTDEYRRASPESRWRMQPEVPPHVPFLCNVTGGRSPVVPDSVHRLRPGDIDVIGALGDSLTSGYGALASNILDFPIDYRGVAATIGGQGNWRTYLTVPNILKEYNPNLIGYGLGTSLAFEEAAQLNVAEDGAISRDMPFMAKYLIRKMRRDPRIDIRKHWKLIYIFIGHNDICTDSCYVPRILDVVENHRTDLIETLRILKNNLPRTLVNIIMTANLKTLSEEANERRTLECYFLPRVECPCLFGLPHQHRRAEIYDVLRSCQRSVEQPVGAN
ncbi:phospholipase B1, membrane-associated-like isoform X2 [Megachile rotundata]|uniref:phospholipase B1, membrane-associated-like isoform X2 n=1 Tax=Megachile rotundata TaxID=143995 RepID=UPI003FD02D3E